MSPSPPPLVLAANRRALLRTAIAISLVTVLAAVFTGLSVNQSQPRFVDWLVGSLLSLYGSSLSYYYWTYCLQHGRQQPAFIADARGLWDHTAFAGWGFLPWSAIASIQNCQLQLKSGGREPALGIVLRDAVWLRRSPGQRWRRWAIRFWYRWPSQPFPITIRCRDLALPPNLDLARAVGDRQPNIALWQSLAPTLSDR
ncbi:MAG: hypothetical protein HC838_11670 [Spirulinaceae cyanobacterium RM2_2_10]|nr:hypothetical protein [Spirulinaceae cyanobacterium SM2_1_0]NJO20559.1 hypothetical protein [Spirulinaceae cyanobacterium RM2_2_10]